MEDQLWALFRETGDPMGYLLYKAEQKQKDTKAERPAPKTHTETPTASA